MGCILEDTMAMEKEVTDAGRMQRTAIGCTADDMQSPIALHSLAAHNIQQATSLGTPEHS